MIRLPTAVDLAGLPRFAVDDVLRGSRPDPARRDEPGRVWIEVDGLPDCLCFYGRDAGPEAGSPVIYLEGDSSRRVDGQWVVFDGYAAQSPATLQRWAEQVALATGRTFVLLARPGVHGSSGNHLERRRPREVALVDAALSALKAAFGWDGLTLAGFSGGGHLVAALLAVRSDVRCAVIGSGNVAVDQRNKAFGWAQDITGFSDFVDPITLVGAVARHPPRTLVVLTDPEDTVVPAPTQTAYVEALRAAGVAVDHRFIAALEPTRHVLTGAVILAAVTADGRGSPART